ncbi:MAG: Amidohydrolase, partial [Chloroflexi bacterium]|nr:Amidohydrolase [Chloroflexota bacterium]
MAADEHTSGHQEREMARVYRVISADSHLEPAVESWTPRVPAKYRDRAPRTIRLENGTDATVNEGRPLHVFLGGMTGKPYEERSPIGGAFDTTPGAGGPQQRVREQDVDGVDAEVLFSGTDGAHEWSGIRDEGAFKAMVHAYNEFLLEDFCSYAPDRLIGLVLIPPTGVDDGITELEWAARMGAKGVCLTRFPSGKGYSSEADDRFWAAAIDHNMPLTAHVSFSGFGAGGRGPLYPFKHDLVEAASGVDPFMKYTKFGLRGGQSAAQMVFGGVFERFPRLKMYFAENQVGWIPNYYEQMDDQYYRHGYWAEKLLEMPRLKRAPSDYAREHCYWGFMRNPFGVKVRHDIGLHHIMWSTDFPHSESDWPNSRRVIEECFAGVP